MFFVVQATLDGGNLSLWHAAVIVLSLVAAILVLCFLLTSGKPKSD